MRCDYVLTYMRYDSETQQWHEEISTLVPWVHPTTVPMHGHIALTSNVDEMAIMFTSSLRNPLPVVEYGTARTHLTQNATGSSTTYAATDMCEEPATRVGQNTYRDPGYFHTVILNNLKPNTRYFYRFGGQGHWSLVYNFISRPVSSHIRNKFIAYAGGQCVISHENLFGVKLN